MRGFANTLDALGIAGQQHLCGLHYILIGQPKPNGQPYTNTDRDWIWLVSAAKDARWNRYIPFDRIVDQRNDEPVIRKWSPPDPEPYLWMNFDDTIPASTQTSARWVVRLHDSWERGRHQPRHGPRPPGNQRSW